MEVLREKHLDWLIGFSLGAGIIFGVLVGHFLPLIPGQQTPWWFLIAVAAVRMLWITVVFLRFLYNYEG